MATEVRTVGTETAARSPALTGGAPLRRALSGYLAALGLDRAATRAAALEVFRRARQRTDLSLTDALWEEVWQFVPASGAVAGVIVLPLEAPLPMPEHDLRAAWRGSETAPVPAEARLLRGGRS